METLLWETSQIGRPHNQPSGAGFKGRRHNFQTEIDLFKAERWGGGGRGPTLLLAAYWTRVDDEMWFPRSELSNFALHLRGNRAAWEQGKWASGGGGGAGGGSGGSCYREVCLNNSMSQAFKKTKEKKRNEKP